MTEAIEKRLKEMRAWHSSTSGGDWENVSALYTSPTLWFPNFDEHLSADKLMKADNQLMNANINFCVKAHSNIPALLDALELAVEELAVIADKDDPSIIAPHVIAKSALKQIEQRLGVSHED